MRPEPTVQTGKDPELRKEVGLWLKELREKAGLSQRDLARLVGFQYYTFISQLENGRGRIPSEKFAVWADAIGIDRKVFVRKLLRHYDPIAFAILFADDSD